ncbi:hypothetical protein BDF19DRAFT_389301, partial [Syncephalis fuscata]
NYKFSKDSIYYDVKAHPINHVNAYFKLATTCEANFSKTFQCFPIRTYGYHPICKLTQKYCVAIYWIKSMRFF